MKRRIFSGLLLATALTPVSLIAQTAADYPDGAVAFVVPFSAGGSNDTIARFLAQELGKRMGEPFVVENRPGGGTALGASYVSRSRPDGQTLLFVSGSYSINAATRTDLPFDPIEDLKAVAVVATGEIGVISGSRLPIGSIDDLVKEANKGDVFYATAGVGSQQHIFAAMLAERLGIKMTPVPYPGGAEGLLDLLGGRVDIVVGTVSGMLTTIEGGATPLAVLSDTRSERLPETPAISELGHPEAIAETYWLVLAPKDTPEDIMTILNQNITEIVNTPESTEFLKTLDAVPTRMLVAEADEFIENEITTWTKLAQDLGISSSN